MIIVATKSKCEIGEVMEGDYLYNNEWITIKAMVLKISNYEEWKKYRVENNLPEIPSAYPNESYYYVIHTD